MGLLGLWLLDAARPTPPPALARVDTPATTRLIVLFVDSLSERDVRGEGAMPKLAARLQRGALHGPVEPCADAITVPCVTAAITGRDQLSVFALASNFASNRSVVDASVLGQLQRAGYRVGYLGERILADTMAGLTYMAADLENDAQVVEQLPRVLAEQRLDVLIAHFRQLDQIAHKRGEAAPEYKAARAAVDAQIDGIIAQLRPTDHVLVMGDHGHTLEGRHAAGLEVTTYALYLGPQFSRAQETRLRMTDHAAIWARVFGFSRATPGWLDDYHAGRVVRPHGAESSLQASPIPRWAGLLAVLLACAICMPAFGAARAERTRAVASFAISVALMTGSGALWPDLRAYLWQSSGRIKLAIAASLLAAVPCGRWLLAWVRSPLRRPPATWQERYAQTLGAALVFALPTVYALGGPSVVQSWLSLGLLGYAFWRRTRGDARRAVQLACAGVLVLSLLPVKHANYVLRGFTVYARILPSLSPHVLPLVAALLVLLALSSARWVASARPSSWLSLSLGAGAAGCAGLVPDRWFALPCVVSLPLVLVALRAPRFTPFALVSAIPAVWFFYEASVRTLVPVLVVWLLCALLPRAFRDSDPGLRGAVLLSLVLMSFRTAMGCRIAGIDFDFFFHFLPDDADVTEHWIAAAMFATAKYLHSVALGLLLAKAGDPDLGRALREGVCLARARVGMCLLFLAGLVVVRPQAGAAAVGDVSQEAACWVIALATLALVSSACQPAEEA